MNELFFTIIVVYSATSIISESSFPLFKWLRTIPYIGDLFDCFLCVSVWVGFLTAWKIYDPASTLGLDFLSWFTSGLFYSAIVWFIHLIEGLFSDE